MIASVCLWSCCVTRVSLKFVCFVPFTFGHATADSATSETAIADLKLQLLLFSCLIRHEWQRCIWPAPSMSFLHCWLDCSIAPAKQSIIASIGRNPAWGVSLLSNPSAEPVPGVTPFHSCRHFFLSYNILAFYNYLFLKLEK